MLRTAIDPDRRDRVPAPWDSQAAISALSLLARRWVPPILLELHAGPLRRHVLRDRLGISDKVLTDTMRVLEEHSLIRRDVTASIPAEVTYSLTDAGRTAEAPLAGLSSWWLRLSDVSLSHHASEMRAV